MLCTGRVLFLSAGQNNHEVMILKHPFLFGAVGYPLLELASRGRTHYAMSLAGGLSCLVINRINRFNIPFGEKAALSALAVTGIEAGAGLIWNKRHKVWDYRRMPLNWKGQICLPYSLLWTAIAAGFLRIDNVCPRR